MIEVTGRKFDYLAEFAIFSSKFKGGIVYPGNAKYYGLLKTLGRLRERYLDQPSWIDPYSLAFPRNHKFYEAFDEKIHQLWTYGLIERYLSAYQKFGDKKFYKKFRHLYLTDGPQVLTMKHLEAGFVICLIAVAFSLLAFAMEWSVKLRDFLVFTNIFATFNTMQQSRSQEIQAIFKNYRKSLAKLEFDEENSWLTIESSENVKNITQTAGSTKNTDLPLRTDDIDIDLIEIL